MYRIVIVEDDQDTLDLLKSYFPKEEFLVHAENDGKQACRTIERIQPDLVVTDVVMPGFGGIEVLEFINQSTLTPIVFLISGYHTVDGADAYEKNAHLFLRKPINQEELISAAKRFLRLRPKPNPNYYLSSREKEILILISKGKTSKEIALDLGISHSTVAKHRENMMNRYEAKNIADLIIKSGIYNMLNP